jgi:hypothetical protein
MTDKDQQLEHFREAVERKADQADEASHAHPRTAGQADDEPGGSSRFQRSKEEPGRPQDTFSVRDKSSGKGKKTADKWNQ